jgi:hypothetical protein
VADLMCDHLGTERALQALQWSGQQEFSHAPRHVWSGSASSHSPAVAPGAAAGYYRGTKADPIAGTGSLTLLTVLNSGHLVPLDVPASALDMVYRFVNSVPFMDRIQDIGTEASGARAYTGLDWSDAIDKGGGGVGWRSSFVGTGGPGGLLLSLILAAAAALCSHKLTVWRMRGATITAEIALSNSSNPHGTSTAVSLDTMNGNIAAQGARLGRTRSGESAGGKENSRSLRQEPPVRLDASNGAGVSSRGGSDHSTHEAARRAPHCREAHYDVDIADGIDLGGERIAKRIAAALELTEGTTPLDGDGIADGIINAASGGGGAISDGGAQLKGEIRDGKEGAGAAQVHTPSPHKLTSAAKTLMERISSEKPRRWDRGEEIVGVNEQVSAANLSKDANASFFGGGSKRFGSSAQGYSPVSSSSPHVTPNMHTRQLVAVAASAVQQAPLNARGSTRKASTSSIAGTSRRQHPPSPLSPHRYEVSSPT